MDDAAEAHICSGPRAFGASDVEVRWDESETFVSLHIRSQIWAVFEAATAMVHLGNFAAGTPPHLPDRLKRV
jgi:hypothetical protein